MVGPGLLEIDRARRLVLDAARPLAAEAVELDEALGRVLAEDAIAAAPVPAFDGSAMDGYAVRAGDLAPSGAGPRRLRIVGESRAGTPCPLVLGDGQAIAISTGAVVPDGADAVVRVEDTAASDGSLEVLAPVAVGENIRRAGEDIETGETAIERSTAIGAAELGVLASLGLASLACVRRPRVSVLVSGDELLSPQEPGRPGGVRDSNSRTISALAAIDGAEVTLVARTPDEREAVTASIGAALEDVDLAILCGGVSVGAHDHVRPSLHELGALEEFWGLALKPGRPTWFGTRGQTLIFGLPGNPVSALVTYVLLVRPALRILRGLPESPRRATAVLEHEYTKAPGRAHAVRCRVSFDAEGSRAALTGPQGSHILTSMLGADALAIIPAPATRLPAGERVEIEPLGAHGWVRA